MIFICILIGIESAFALNIQDVLKESFRSLEWKKNPVTNLKAKNIDAEFVIEMSNHERLLPFLQLIPYEYRIAFVSTSPPLQAAIDQAMESILKTPTGQKICQNSTNGEWQRIRTYFGVSESAARKLSTDCQSKSPFTMIIKKSHVHEWILIEHRDSRFPVEGWTTPLNVSFLFFREDQWNLLEFYRTLIHEVATALDTKQSLGLLGTLNLLSKMTRAEYQGSRECAVVRALNRPSIKYATSALRAEVIENQILSELGFSSTEINFRNNLSIRSCVDKIVDKIPKVLAIGDIVSSYAAAGDFSSKICLGSDRDAVSKAKHNIISDLILLDEEKIMDLESQTLDTVCEYLVRPRVSSYFIGTYTGGPRPKVEPWEKESYSSMSNTLKAEISLQRNGSESRRPGLLKSIDHMEGDRSELGLINQRKEKLKKVFEE